MNHRTIRSIKRRLARPYIFVTNFLHHVRRQPLRVALDMAGKTLP